MANKFLIRLLIGLSGLILIILIFAPLIVRKVVVNQSKEWIGRSIGWEKFKVNYFTGTIKLVDFKLLEPDDSTVFVSFDTLLVNAEPYRLLSNELVVEKFYLSGLSTNVVLRDSAFNFDDLLQLIPDDTVSTPEEPEDPLEMQFSNIELKDAFFTATDVDIDRSMELSNFNFFIPYIALNQEEKSKADLRFDFKNGGYFESAVDINPTKGDFEAEITLEDLQIAGYGEFVHKFINVGDFEGLVNTQLTLEGNINQPGAATASGTFALHDFVLKDHDQKQIVGIQNLRVLLEKIDPANSSFVIDSIQMEQPYVFFEMYDSTNNIMDYIEGMMPEKDLSSSPNIDEFASQDTVSNELYYALHNFIMDRGVVEIVDNRTGEPFKYNLSEIHMSVDSISSTSAWLETNSDMLLNKRGKLVAQLGLNPAAPMAQMTVDYTITDFMLSDLNIYSSHYMGFPILYGDMYYKAHTEIIDGQIASENNLIIHNVELGDKRGGLYDLPLRFALFLLKDKDGVITLDVPVSGDLKDPSVSVGKIVWNTFKNLIVKAAATPVKLLSGLIGADPKDIEAIEYDYLDTAFTETRSKQLDLLLQLEQQKPELEIDLLYLNDPMLEKKELAMLQVGRKFEEKYKIRNHRLDVDEFETYVRAQTESDSISLADACLLLADSVALDSTFEGITNKRIMDVSAYLMQQNDSTEIVVVPFQVGAPKNLGSRPQFEVKYGMKPSHIQ